MKKEKIYIDVEIDSEKLESIIEYFEKIDKKAKKLKEDGISKRNINKIIKKCLKIK